MDKVLHILSELAIDILCLVIFKLDGEISFLSNEEIILNNNELHILTKILYYNENTLTEGHLSEEIAVVINKISKSKKYFGIKEEYKDYYILKIFSTSNSSDLYLDNYKAIFTKISFHVNEHLENIKFPQKSTYRIDPSYITNKQFSIDKSKILQFLGAIKIIKYPIKQKNTGQIIILSQQQSRIMLGLSSGYSFREIEEKYGIKIKTIEYYLLLIKAKTGYRKRLELLCAFRETNPWLKEFKDE